MDSWELDDGTLSLTSPLSVLVDRKPYTTSEDKLGYRTEGNAGKSLSH